MCAFVYNICFLIHFFQPMALNDTLRKKTQFSNEFVVVIDNDDDEFFLWLVDKNKVFSLYPIRDHCQRSSPSRIPSNKGSFEVHQKVVLNLSIFLFLICTKINCCEKKDSWNCWKFLRKSSMAIKLGKSAKSIVSFLGKQG